jgi:hypothetical protein
MGEKARLMVERVPMVNTAEWFCWRRYWRVSGLRVLAEKGAG